jgi:hypothetical protein
MYNQEFRHVQSHHKHNSNQLAVRSTELAQAPQQAKPQFIRTGTSTDSVQLSSSDKAALAAMENQIPNLGVTERGRVLDAAALAAYQAQVEARNSSDS